MSLVPTTFNAAFKAAFKAVLCGALALLSLAAPAQTAQTAQGAPSQQGAWPSRPIRLLVGFPPGSSPDFIARAFAEPLAKVLGQPVVVENRVGASGNIAAAAVAQATDRHTLGVVINGNMTVARLLNPATPYDPLKDLLPVSLLCKAPLLLAAPENLASGTPREFFDTARAKGAAWSYGSPGIGTVGHLGMELVKDKAGLAPVHVPYPSYQRVVMAMLGGEVQVSLVQLGAAMPMVALGKLKALGITAAARSPLAPELPTLAEAGIPGVALEVWTGIAAPASLPPELVARLSAAFGRIAATEEVRRALVHHGYESVGIDAAGFAKRIKSDYEELGRIIKTQGIKVE